MTDQISNIDISEIVVLERLRSVDKNWCEVLAASIQNDGLQQPITVVTGRNAPIFLADGAHRLAAAKEAGWKSIPAIVERLPNRKDIVPTILSHEITANLLRNDLKVLDRAETLLAHQRLHSNVDYNSDSRASLEQLQSAKFGDLRFSASAAETTGLSERTIQRLTGIAKNLSPDSKARIADTWIANHQANLEKLAGQPDDLQGDILDLILATPPQAKNVTEALDIIAERPKPTVSEKAYKSVVNNFGRLPRKDQYAFFQQHEAAIQGWMKDKARG